MLSASGGLRPPDQGLCPWTSLGLRSQTPVIDSRSALAMRPPKSNFDNLSTFGILPTGGSRSASGQMLTDYQNSLTVGLSGDP